MTQTVLDFEGVEAREIDNGQLTMDNGGTSPSAAAAPTSKGDCDGHGQARTDTEGSNGNHGVTEELAGPGIEEVARFGLHFSPGDPGTSALAAKNHFESGKMTRNMRAVLKAVDLWPGRTAVELYRAMAASGLSEFDEISRHEVSRRTADLVKSGVVYKGCPRRCTVNNTHMATWWPCAGRN